jgi:hypothetical protein
MIGKKFSRLLVIKKAEKNKWGKVQWICRCDCGTEKTISEHTLKSGGTRSCGCLVKERIKTINEFKEYQIYILGDMKAINEKHVLSKLGKLLFNLSRRNLTTVKTYEPILKGTIEIKQKIKRRFVCKEK